MDIVTEWDKSRGQENRNKREGNLDEKWKKNWDGEDSYGENQNYEMKS